LRMASRMTANAFPTSRRFRSVRAKCENDANSGLAGDWRPQKARGRRFPNHAVKDALD
jgi:hypothetical protein